MEHGGEVGWDLGETAVEHVVCLEGGEGLEQDGRRLFERAGALEVSFWEGFPHVVLHNAAEGPRWLADDDVAEAEIVRVGVGDAATDADHEAEAEGGEGDGHARGEHGG